MFRVFTFQKGFLLRVRLVVSANPEVSKKHYAWKQVNLEKDPESAVEAEMLKQLKHRNIICLHAAYLEGGVLVLLCWLCLFFNTQARPFRVDFYFFGCFLSKSKV